MLMLGNGSKMEDGMNDDTKNKETYELGVNTSNDLYNLDGLKMRMMINLK